MRRPKRSRSRARFERELQAAQVLNSADSSPENERATPTLTFVRPGSGGPGESVCLYVRAYIYIILARTRSPKRICTVYTRTQVEKIVGFRNIRGVPHYKVHWQSYSRDQDSWEPAKNLAACSVLLDEYHARKAAASPPKVRGGGWAAGLEVLIGHLCAVYSTYLYINFPRYMLWVLLLSLHQRNTVCTPADSSFACIFRPGVPPVIWLPLGSPRPSRCQKMRSCPCSVAASEHGPQLTTLRVKWPPRLPGNSRRQHHPPNPRAPGRDSSV